MKGCNTLLVGRQCEATRNYKDVVVPDVVGDESEMKLGIFEMILR